MALRETEREAQVVDLVAKRGARNGAGGQIASPTIAPASAAEPSHTVSGATTIPAQNHATTESQKTKRVSGKSSSAQPPTARNPAPGRKRPSPKVCQPAGIPSSVGSTARTHTMPYTSALRRCREAVTGPFVPLRKSISPDGMLWPARAELEGPTVPSL